MSTTTPLPTPELVAALANQYIEERTGPAPEVISPEQNYLAIKRAFEKIIGPLDLGDRLHWVLRNAAENLAAALGYPAPYETRVTLADGTKLPPERHTITHFTDGEVGTDGQGFKHEDWVAISALDVGDTYLVAGATAVMAVTRVE